MKPSELMRRGHTWAFLAVALLAATDCNEQSARPSQTERTLDDLSRRLDTEQLKREHEAARHQAELAINRADLLGATMIWISTALAVVILALLLARERRARRVLERIVHLLLGRLRNSRDPPS